MTIDYTAVLARAAALAQSYAGPPPYSVIVGEPIALPADGEPWCAMWFETTEDPPVGGMSFTNVMIQENLTVRTFWFVRPEASTVATFEAQAWGGARALQALFRGDSTLNELVTDLTVGHLQRSIGQFPVPLEQGHPSPYYVTIEFSCGLIDLEAEAIAR